MHKSCTLSSRPSNSRRSDTITSAQIELLRWKVQPGPFPRLLSAG